MLLSDIFALLRNEREYHLRRWGNRQPDGTFVEQPHSIGEFLIYMRDYYEEATHGLTRNAGSRETLFSLRKIVALGLACLEQNDSYDGAPVTLDDLFETVRVTGRMVPLHSRFRTDMSTYLLKIRQCLTEGEKGTGNLCWGEGLLCVREIVQIGIECFERLRLAGPRGSRPHHQHARRAAGMKLYFVRRKDSGAYLEWKRVAIHWASARQEASHYPERRVADVCL